MCHTKLTAYSVALSSLAELARKIGTSLDDVIAKVTVDWAAATKMVEDSRQETFELVDAMFGPDPNARAAAWINNQVGAQLISELKKVGIAGKL